MRICLVVHGFPPYERTGVEVYTESLARALARAGHAVEVFAPRAAPELPELSLRREERDGYAVTWLATNHPPRDARAALEPPAVAERFGDFLDAEQPEVVHFQHLVKLGVGLVDAARARGIPTLYTAHDYWAVCHRYTFVRPDLSRCDVIGDAMACAQCDLALSFLNRREELGDYQMGALPEQLDEEARDALAHLLGSEPEAAGFTHEDLDAAFDLRRELDARRARAVGALDWILAPTRFLAERLVQGGVPRERVEVLPYGIETSDLRDLPPVRPGGGAEPVRFGFLGGLAKHKGVHVLLDAFARLREPAELTIRGGSSDRPYVERLRERAAEVGAVWGGPYGRSELPAILAELDVVVVPSTWVENQPLVIREAFAARRPVIASDVGALPESVRDGVDGLLFAPGDPEALARAMRRCATEERLVARLAAGAPRVPDVREQADDLAGRYARLVERRTADEASDELPSSLRPLAARRRELGRLPTRELYARALRGLERLRRGLGGAAAALPPEELLVRALGAGSRAQVLVRDRAREAEWVKAQLGAGERELAWVRGVAAGRDQELQSFTREVEWLREERRALEEERDWLRGVAEAKHAELEAVRARIDATEREAAGLRDTGERLGEHLRNTAELGLVALEAQEHVLGEEVRPLLEILRRAAAEEEVPAEEEPGEADTAVLDSLVHGVRLGAERLARLERELAWRRAEMARASEAARRRLARLILGRTGLGRAALGWEDARRPREERP